MNALTPEQREIVARLQSGRLMICDGQGDPNSDGCGGQGYTGAAGREPCPHCYGAGVMTPELRAALASAPSPEAGAGADLGELKGACLTAPGSCPSGPTASRSSGFAAAIPSRGLSDLAEIADLRAAYNILHAEIICDQPRNLVDKAKALAYCAVVARSHILSFLDLFDKNRPGLCASCDEHPQGEDPQGAESRSDASAVAEGQTPEAKPKSSPDQTPVDPQMTVEEAREVLDGIHPAFESPQVRAEFLRWCGGTKADAEAARIEMALRILAPSDAPSTTEADR